MIVPVVPAELDRNAEEVPETFGGEKIQLCSIREDAAVLEQDNAADLGNYVRQMMRDNQYAGAGLGQLSEQCAQLERGVDVQAIGGFVQQQRQRIVNHGAGD